MLPEGRDVEFERHESSNNILWLNEVSHESKLEAIRLGAPVWQVHHYQQIQDASKQILSRNPEFYQFFDKIRIGRLLNNVLNNRQSIRKVFQLYYALVWLYR